MVFRLLKSVSLACVLWPGVISMANAQADDAAVAQQPGEPAVGQQASVAATTQSPARFDEQLRLKGWNASFPGFGETVTQDAGGWRSTLADHGFGLVVWNTGVVETNLMGGGAYRGTPQRYWGQSFDGADTTTAWLTYDTSRWGIPDGQISLAALTAISTYQAYDANRTTLGELAWYQTLFNRQVELKVGYVAGGNEWVGFYTGGNVVNPFGSSSYIPYEMGLAQLNAVQPSARVKFNLTKNIYNQFGVMRSLGIDGPSGSVFTDDKTFNPQGIKLTVPNGKALVMDEVGYRRESAPNTKSAWFRAGVMYNTSTFPDYRTGGTKSGSGAGYVLGDMQLFQSNPGSATQAYRGVYAGATFMYGPPQNIAVSRYYELRLYTLGLFASRPEDQITFLYSRNAYSRYVVNNTNANSDVTGELAGPNANAFTLGYGYKVRPGVYLNAGVQYVNRPTFTYTSNQGHSLNFIFTTFIAF